MFRRMPMPYQVAVLAGSALLLSLTTASSQTSAVSSDDVEAAAVIPPNVVIILVDDARFRDMSTLPNVRKLIKDPGATFTNAVSPFPLCCPARATLLTGQYAHNHGVLGNGDAFNPLGGFSAFEDDQTLATWLNADYATGWFGKYLNGYEGTYVPPGWDAWKASSGNEQNWINYRSQTINVNGTVRTFNRYQTDLVGEFATTFINARAPQPQPFFMVTSLLAPHTGEPVESDDPNRVYGTTKYSTPNVADAYRNALSTTPLDEDPSFNEADVSDKPQQPPLLAPWEVSALKEVNQQRRESLLSAQAVVGKVIAALKANGELANTYVIFLSDNGYMMGEHRIRSGKSQAYEPAVRVPLLMRGPGIPPGTVLTQPVGQQDLAPTVLAMTNHVGANGSLVIDGKNLLPLVADPTLNTNRPIVLEVGPATTTNPAYRFHGIRMPGWKYLERAGGVKELYDLTADPYELSNLAGKPAYAAKQAELTALLNQYKWCAGAQCP